MRELLRFATFIFSVWGGSCLYMAWRLTGPLAKGSPLRPVAWALAAATAILVPWAMVRQRRPHPPRLMMPAAYAVMSFAAMLLPPVIVRDLVWGGLLAVDAFAPARGGLAWLADPAARFAAARAFNAVALVAGVLLTVLGYLQARRLPRTLCVTIPIPGLHPDLEGFRIVLLADLHAGATIRRDRIEAIAGLARGLKPDLVAVAGDLADGHVRDVLPLLAPLRRVRAPLGTFFVTGNHDYYWDPAGWLKGARSLGMTPLVNEARVLARKRARLVVAGVPDPTGAEFGVAPRPSPAHAFRGMPRRAFRLLLAHQPELADAGARAGADLIVSGHTHGGQLMPWALIARRVHRCVAGLCRVDHSWLFVTTGANYWGAPNRLGVPTEVVLLTLSRG
jgi:hypothetical protein